MNNHIKGFNQFINEGFNQEELEAWRDLKKFGLLSAEDEIAFVAAELSIKFGVELVQVYSSMEDDNPDEVFGHYVTYSPKELSNTVPDLDMTVIIYRDLRVQFAWDSVLYPSTHHSRKQSMAMVNDDTPFPLPWTKFDRRDWEHFASHVQETM